ncbi:hypothetical protein KVH30_06145 [Streptomyces olivaceus]|uniref:hypothetical protein n=1 Tax=Streptomyces olivaceus TaxID=47716 RepID=UPI001CCEAF40|nr:hypothetical protein [Streptomyces olivaceus]MBZ6291153.1 hypothetical protein [Streptomyces olivaceus]MBZ6325105.1 hypothetical protein [Streptomyces olivaceus]
MTVRGWCRAVRAGVFAAVCVLLAALGHATMSGEPVPWWTLAAGAAATGAVGWLLAGRERGLPLVVTVVTAAQLVLHETFSKAQTLAAPPLSHPPAPTGTGSPHAHSLHTGSLGPHSLHTGSLGTHSLHTGSMGGMDMGGAAHAGHGMPGLGHVHTMSGASSVGMFAAHLLAAVLCGLWLAHGERAVFRVLRAAAAWLAAPLRLLLALPTPVCRPSVRRRRTAVVDATVRLLLRSSLTFRGPPVGAAVV